MIKNRIKDCYKALLTYLMGVEPIILGGFFLVLAAFAILLIFIVLAPPL